MDEQLYSTYIVASQSRILYIGVTGNLLRRVFERKWKSAMDSAADTTATDLSGLNIIRRSGSRLLGKSS